MTLRWSLKRTLIGLATLGAAVAVIVGAMGQLSTKRLGGAMAEMSSATTATREAMMGDMMHDALRADVLRALHAARTAPGDKKAVIDDLTEHAEAFRTALAAVDSLELGGAVEQAMTDLRRPLEQYIASAEELTRLAFQSSAQAEARYPEFQKAFEVLEGKMEAFGDATVQHSNDAATGGKRAEATMSMMILAVLLGGAALVFIIGSLVSAAIVRDVVEVKRVTSLVGDGDLNARAAVSSKNELGDVAEALNEAVVGMRTALQADRVKWDDVGRQREEVNRVKQMVENAPINIVYADRDFVIRYVNRSAVALFKSLEQYLPIRADQLVGQSIDSLHQDLAHQRRTLSDPKSLPHTAKIRIGPEDVELRISAIMDEKGAYLGPMLSWDVVTAKLRAEAQVLESQQRETAAAGELRAKVDDILSVVTAAGEGDLTTSITVRGDDAIGQLGTGLARFFDDLKKSLGEIRSAGGQLTVSSGELTHTSQSMSSAAEETSAQASVVSAAADEVSRNVQSVATGTEQMMESIREISRNANDAARVAAQAVSAVESADTTVNKLGTSSAEIGDVIKVITAIAQQTNLLALNATIEAARAGEAGKGFAVVANEVKELAKETAKATEDISRRIVAIQGDTSSAVGAIREIREVVQKISEIQVSIASAVEEQTATTTEMGRSLGEAARGAAEIAQNITGVAEAAQETTRGATDALRAGESVARLAERLDAQVTRFRVEEPGVVVTKASASTRPPVTAPRNGKTPVPARR